MSLILYCRGEFSFFGKLNFVIWKLYKETASACARNMQLWEPGFTSLLNSLDTCIVWLYQSQLMLQRCRALHSPTLTLTSISIHAIIPLNMMHAVSCRHQRRVITYTASGLLEMTVYVIACTRKRNQVFAIRLL